MSDRVNHPPHYGGQGNPLEVINIIEEYALGFSLGNAIKYILRAGRKDGADELEDLKKANWYLVREIERRQRIQTHTEAAQPKEKRR